jgi:hypothetical protein
VVQEQIGKAVNSRILHGESSAIFEARRPSKDNGLNSLLALRASIQRISGSAWANTANHDRLFGMREQPRGGAPYNS